MSPQDSGASELLSKVTFPLNRAAATAETPPEAQACQLQLNRRLLVSVVNPAQDIWLQHPSKLLFLPLVSHFRQDLRLD